MIRIQENSTTSERRDYIISNLGPYKRHIKVFKDKDEDNSLIVTNRKSMSIDRIALDFTELRKPNQPLSGGVGNWAFAFFIGTIPSRFVLIANIYKKDGRSHSECYDIIENLKKEILSKFTHLKSNKSKIKSYDLTVGLSITDDEVFGERDVDKNLKVVRYMYNRAKRFGTVTGRKDV